MLVAADFRERARMALQNQWFPAVLTGFVGGLLGASTTLLDDGGSGGSSSSESSEQNLENLEMMGLGDTVTEIMTNPIIQAVIVMLGVFLIVVVVWAIVMFIIGGPITLGYARYNLNLVDGFNPQFSDLFSKFDCFGQGFCVQFLRRLFITLWTLLFVIPGLVKTYSYSMAAYIAAENPDMSATDAITASKELMDGNKWRLFCLDLSFIGWSILCVFTLGIGFLFLKPYREAAFAAFYREIVSERTAVMSNYTNVEDLRKNSHKGLHMKSIRVFQDRTCKELGDLYGLFFEDINHAADGGLYAELVQNRSFEFCEIDKPEYHSLTAWDKSEDCQWEVLSERPLNEENTHYLQVEAKCGSYIVNSGFNSGIFVEKDKEYTFSVYVRTPVDGGVLKVSVTDGTGMMCTCAEILVQASQGFVKYQALLKGTATTWNGKLYLTFENEGTYELDMVSLFPVDTYKGRENGLRKDIAEALAEMKPKFMRFPGGCLTHDGALDDHARNSMYRWKRTLGSIEKRPSWKNNWRYNQTLGLGYYEYFCFCEDMGAKPLPVVPAGFNPHKGEGVAIEELGTWVQETLDLIEFANGDECTPMGKVRSEMGHPAPFGLEYVGVGNEEIGAGFFERYPYFHKAIREKYPEIKIINTAGPFAVGEGYEDGWRSAREYGSDLIDEHYYSSPEWFLANMHHYEDYDDKGPKVFLGEYASWGNTYYNAIVEAAYMTHLERSKAVALACYAPMLCNVDYVNWQPDMLWFDNHRIMKTPNYYVQKMFMEHQGTDAVEFELQGLDEIIPLTDEVNLTGGITVAGNDITGRIWDVQVEEDGVVRTLADLTISDNTQHHLTDITGKKYTLTFKFSRESGRKGLKLNFGKRDDKNFLQWEFGGWDNWDCNIMNVSKGRGSTISHRIFHVEDIEYTLKLEVDGRHIRTYVNGENYNDVVDRLPELEELYVTASVDKEQGTTIVKAVNLTGEEKEVRLTLEGIEKKQAEIISLAGYALDAVNTLDEPDRIVTTSSNAVLIENGLSYSFPSHSVTVMVFS